MSLYDIKDLSMWGGDSAARSHVNQLLGAAKVDHQTLWEATKQIHALLDVANAHAADIARLQAVVYTLMQIITDAKLIDPNELDTRIAAAIRTV